MSALPSAATQSLSAAPSGAPAANELLPLTPAQRRTLDRLVPVVQAATITVLQGDAGVGKTTILHHLRQRLGGRYIGILDLIEKLKGQDPLALDEAVHTLFAEALAQTDLVIFDDLAKLEQVTRHQMAYPRPYLFESLLKSIFGIAHANGKRIVFTRQDEEHSYDGTKAQAVRILVEHFSGPDYRAILAHHAGAESIKQVDTDKLSKDFSGLNGYQLKAASLVLKNLGHANLTTELIGDAIVTYLVTGNLDISEVENVGFDELKGSEHMIEVLERTVLLPLEDTVRARELGLKAKRGVLLHGAPGTGKTTIGRALAHRMKGRFFMIDGTIISEPPSEFFDKVDRIFKAAQANSPSVIFIDDADVLLKTDHVYGLNRYLLTKLDGLESETVGNVCVIMTAMDIQDIPAPLLRSGRVEVWLETRLPDLDNRALIIAHYTKDLPEAFRRYDEVRIAHVTEGFTPADLRRIVGDAKGLLAYDQHKERPEVSFNEYLVKAALDLRELKNTIARTLRGPELGATEYDLFSCGYA